MYFWLSKTCIKWGLVRNLLCYLSFICLIETIEIRYIVCNFNYTILLRYRKINFNKIIDTTPFLRFEIRRFFSKMSYYKKWISSTKKNVQFVTVWKNEKFTLTKKIFREINKRNFFFKTVVLMNFLSKNWE